MSRNVDKNQEDLDILRKIYKNPSITQREMAGELGLSLGKLNYCLIKLKDKGIIKINNFKKNKKKIRYLYLLTPKGISLKTTLTINFMKKKMREYDELKKELKKIK
jgi:EPS-associated MarR family transcriptional regulator